MSLAYPWTGEEYAGPKLGCGMPATRVLRSLATPPGFLRKPSGEGRYSSFCPGPNRRSGRRCLTKSLARKALSNIFG